MVHLCCNIYHVLFCTFEIVSKLLNFDVLMIDFFIKVLCFIFGSLHYANDSFDLSILIFDMLLLVLKQLSVVHVFDISSVYRRLFWAPRSVLAFLRSFILTPQTWLNLCLNLIYKVNAATPLFFLELRMLSWFILIGIEELFEVVILSFDWTPGSFKEVHLLANWLIGGT